MKVLLQDLKSLKYLAVSGKWTHDLDEAMDFGDVTRAVNVVCARRVRKVRVVLKFAHPAADVVLPPVPASSDFDDPVFPAQSSMVTAQNIFPTVGQAAKTRLAGTFPATPNLRDRSSDL